MRTRIKICGITRLEDARAAMDAGADALGFVFYPPSPRYIAPEQAAEIIAALPPFVTMTGLFVDASAAEVQRTIDLTRIDLLQFHGNESPAFCDSFARAWIKALRVAPGMDLTAMVDQYAAARAVLLDTYVSGVPGGTGSVFDWSVIPEALRPGIILAGGLDADNVAAAIQQIRPWAVDVSGGVEARKGIKDIHEIKRFVNEVKSVND
ncbi:phosphoribosylanthranilate isomerase [Nitrincola alkalilacustris]|uniref:phosphoribosylanthranilate isomerase n=1 Tax=Nitrincola alkalilacustris TaxID=1571224 RepID=UPI00124C4204|nr:phosphoribosylanthranilate isomerase [Nitrincola alkalilacustris]